jgi:hypothetical protein
MNGDRVARDAAVVCHGSTQMAAYSDNEPIIVERGDRHELIDVHGRRTDEIVWLSVQAVIQSGHATVGDVIVVLAGSPIEPEPATDTIRLGRVRSVES